MPANVGQMFYYGEVPWHGEGTKLKEPADLETAIAAGGLDWEVTKVPLQTEDSPPSPVERRVAVVRTDREAGDPRPVLGVVYPGFKPLQNRAALTMFDRLLQGGELGRSPQGYHTGGFLGNGEVIWLLARLGDPIMVTPDDRVEPYALFSNSHDGTRAVDIRLTAVRVVCQNTLGLALKGKSPMVFKHAHDDDVTGIERAAKLFLAAWWETLGAYETDFRQMQNIKVNEKEFAGFLEKHLLPDPKRPTARQPSKQAVALYATRLEKARENRRGIMEVWYEGLPRHSPKPVPPAGPTLWGALNAVTAFVDHAQEVTGDRYAYTVLGPGAAFKSRAYSLLQEQFVKPPASGG